MIDSEGLGGRPSAWPISIISGVANRQGECHHRKASGERRGDGGRASAACRKATASPGAEVCDTARPSHHQCGVHALGAGDQQRVCKLGDFAAKLPLGRHRAGLTNTPVTNTATAALPPERSGMASGMDMSARMISLSINIALMGLILSSSVSGYVLEALPKAPSDAMLGIISDLISAGNLAITENHGVSVALAQEALAHGIGRVTLYGAMSAMILALASQSSEIAARPLKASGPVQSPADTLSFARGWSQAPHGRH